MSDALSVVADDVNNTSGYDQFLDSVRKKGTTMRTHIICVLRKSA